MLQPVRADNAASLSRKTHAGIQQRVSQEHTLGHGKERHLCDIARAAAVLGLRENDVAPAVGRGEEVAGLSAPRLRILADFVVLPFAMLVKRTSVRLGGGVCTPHGIAPALVTVCHLHARHVLHEP